jgi:hypothetical protein
MLFNVGEAASYDYVEAVARTRTAAEQGKIKAQKDLGLAYAIGQDVPQDYAQAAIWYRKAANQGDAEAQFYLGLFHLDESIFPAGTTEGISWLAKAAEQGFDEAQFELGLLYSKGGNGVEQDNAEAFFWFELAATGMTRSTGEKFIEARDVAAEKLSPAQQSEQRQRVHKWLERYSLPQR